jgi:hypothetical protein
LKIVVKKATNQKIALQRIIADLQLKRSRVWSEKLIRQEIAPRRTSSQVLPQRFRNKPEHAM